MIALGRRGGGSRGRKGPVFTLSPLWTDGQTKVSSSGFDRWKSWNGFATLFLQFIFLVFFLVHYRYSNSSSQVFFSGGNGNTVMLFVSSQSLVEKFANCFLGSNFSSPKVEKRNYNINKMSQSLETSIIFLFSLVGFGLGDVRESFLPPPPSLSLSKHSCLSDGTRKWVFGPVFFGGWVRGGNGALSLFSFGCFDRSPSKAGNLRNISCLVFWASAEKMYASRKLKPIVKSGKWKQNCCILSVSQVNSHICSAFFREKNL